MHATPPVAPDAHDLAGDAPDVAPLLIGCALAWDDCVGIIVETEAYHEREASCHASRGRTERNDPMFGPAGTLYVYFTYGMHWCVNVVCGNPDEAAAVLIRAAVPAAGIDRMRERRTSGAARRDDRRILGGPACLAQALGLDRQANRVAVVPGVDGATDEVGQDRCIRRASPDEWSTAVAADPALATLGRADVIASGPRIGISAAVDLPWRFALAGSRYLSRPLS